jgi:hypothetical protein
MLARHLGEGVADADADDADDAVASWRQEQREAARVQQEGREKRMAARRAEREEQTRQHGGLHGRRLARRRARRIPAQGPASLSRFVEVSVTGEEACRMCEAPDEYVGELMAFVRAVAVEAKTP